MILCSLAVNRDRPQLASFRDAIAIRLTEQMSRVETGLDPLGQLNLVGGA